MQRTINEQPGFFAREADATGKESGLFASERNDIAGIVASATSREHIVRVEARTATDLVLRSSLVAEKRIAAEDLTWS